MKNQTFAAYRYLPTDQIHILDLDLFQKQTMPDGATSLACKYIDYEGEKAFDVIASGEQDEPGITYVPLSEKENAEIMEAYIKCPMAVPAQGCFDLKEVIGQFGEYQFAMRTIDPEHVLATVEIIEPKESANPASNNCASPLKLTWNARESQYKVNKPLDQSGEYVDKSIADVLLAALVDLKQRCLADDPEFNLPSVNAAIELAITKSLIIKPAKS